LFTFFSLLQEFFYQVKGIAFGLTGFLTADFPTKHRWLFLALSWVPWKALNSFFNRKMCAAKLGSPGDI
jgi:hypothetical protein